MNLKISKTKTYVGFAIKSKQIILGTDEILKQKFLHLVIISSALQESSKNKIIAFAQKTNTKLIEFEESEIEFVLNRTNVKAFAITNKGLADAIKKLFS